MADAMVHLRNLSVILDEHESALAAYLESETRRLATCRDVTGFAGEVVQQPTAVHNVGELAPFLKQHLSACNSLRAECEGLPRDARMAQVIELAARVIRSLFVVEALDPDVDILVMAKKRHVVLNLGQVLTVTIRLVLETLDAGEAMAVLHQFCGVVERIVSTAPHLRRAFAKAYTELLELCCAKPAKKTSQSSVDAEATPHQSDETSAPSRGLDDVEKAATRQRTTPPRVDDKAPVDGDTATPQQSAEPPPIGDEAAAESSPAAAKCLKVAGKLVENPSKALFRHAVEAIRTACLQWAAFRTLAPSPASLEALQRAIAMVVDCVCTHAVMDLPLALVKKFQGNLRQIRERLPVAEAFVASAHDKLHVFIADEQRRLTQVRNAVPNAAPVATSLSAKPKRQLMLMSKLNKTLDAVKKSPKHQSQLADFDAALQLLSEIVAYTHPSWHPAAIPDVVELADELLARVCTLSFDNAIAERRARLSVIRTTLNGLPTPAQVAASTMPSETKPATSAPEVTPSSPASAETVEAVAANRTELPVSDVTSETKTPKPKDAPPKSVPGPALIEKINDTAALEARPSPAQPSAQSSATGIPSDIQDDQRVEDGHQASAAPLAVLEPAALVESAPLLALADETPSHEPDEQLALKESLVAEEPLEIVVRNVVAAADGICCLDGTGSSDKRTRASELARTLRVVLERIKASDSVELETFTQIEWCVDATIGAMGGDTDRARELVATLLPVVTELNSADASILSSITRLRKSLEELSTAAAAAGGGPLPAKRTASDASYRTWQLLTTSCLRLARQVGASTAPGEAQDRLRDLLSLLESSVAIAVTSLTSALSTALSDDERTSYVAFGRALALVRSRDKIMDVALEQSDRALRAFMSAWQIEHS